MKQNYVDIKFKLGDPWIILSAIEQSIKSKLEKHGVPLSEWPDIKINYGIKTGLNEAFIIDEKKREQILNSCKTLEEKELTDKLIRPILRGRDIKRNSYEWAHYYIILAYFDSHKFIPTKCPSIYNHLKCFENDLKNRGQCKYLSSGKTRNVNDHDYPGYQGMHHWLELDNCPTKKYLDDFNSKKICWPDISNQSAFCQINDFYYVTNTAYILVNGQDWLCEYLNSKIANWYIKLIASGLGDSGSRFIKQFIVKIPIPSDYSKDFYQKLGLSLEEINYLENSLS